MLDLNSTLKENTNDYISDYYQNKSCSISDGDHVVIEDSNAEVMF